MAAATRLSAVWPTGLFGLVLVGCWYSLKEIGGLALTDTPVAFVAAVPVLAAFLLYHDGRALAADPTRSDIFVDCLIFLGLCSAGAYLLFFLPAQLAWYYWLQRLDLLLVPMFATAVAVLGWGTGGALTIWRPLAYLLLIWPYPFVLVQQVVGPLFTDLSAGFVAVLVRVLALPIAVASGDPHKFVGTGPESFTIIIDSTCSGMNALFGFLIVAVPLAATWSGTRSNKVYWLASGMLIAWLSNLVRVGILFVLAAQAGVDFALGTVHPVLGVVLFAMAFALMLGLRGAFGLETESKASVPLGSSQMAVRPKRAATVAIGVGTVLFAVGQLVLTQFGPLTTETLPSIPVRQTWGLLPELNGWTRELRPEISWQNLFGPMSQARLVRYRSGSASMVVQFVATPDKRLLDTYNPENCDLFHGERIVGVSTVDLDYGLTARLVETQVPRDGGRPALATATLYWFMPVTVGEQQYHTRIALLADTEMLPASPPAPLPRATSPVARLPSFLATRFSPYAMASGTGEFGALDSYVLSFGREVVQTIMSGRPA